ncbi:MAG: hypothetical protein IJG13_07350 [Kiritimatiellae bacterium]|nr:hypothetical protein [Kiritimatiellia bacterium]
MLFEKIEEKKAFAATAHSDQNLDEIMVFGSYKFFQKNVSFYRHLISPGLMFRSDAQKFKTRVLYHLCGLESMAALSFCAAAQKLKARSVCGVATSIRVVGWACVDCSSGESFVVSGMRERGESEMMLAYDDGLRQSDLGQEQNKRGDGQARVARGLRARVLEACAECTQG